MKSINAETTELTEKELESLFGGGYITVYHLSEDGKLIVERIKV